MIENEQQSVRLIYVKIRWGGKLMVNADSRYASRFERAKAKIAALFKREDT
ncbi:MAG: hypothetical protein ABL891_13900 [Burkholderiales bacterium]